MLAHPWLIAGTLLVAVAVVLALRYRTKKRAEIAQDFQKWLAGRSKCHTKIDAAYAAAATTFILRMLMDESRDIVLEARGPLDGWYKVDPDDRGPITLLKYAKPVWESQVESGGYYGTRPELSRYAKDFVVYLQRRVYDPESDFPARLMRDMIAEASRAQTVELTRGWPLTDHLPPLSALDLPTRNGRSLEEVVDELSNDKVRMSRIQAHVEAAHKALAERKPAPIDIFARAQERFDRTIAELQAILDEHGEGIKRLRQMLLDLPVTSALFEGEGRPWGTIHCRLSRRQLNEFFIAYDDEREGRRLAKTGITV